MSIDKQASHWVQGLLAASMFWLTGCDDAMHARYSTAAEARAEGAIQRGWLPEELPDSATDISESHDLDTNTGNGMFRFLEVDSNAFRAKLQPATLGQVEKFRDHQRLQREGYTFHVVPEFVLAVNWQTRHVWFALVLQP